MALAKFSRVALEEGLFHGEGQGIVSSRDDQGMAFWTGHGIGRFTGPGKVSFRFVILSNTFGILGRKVVVSK